MPGDVLPMEPVKKFEYANNHEYFEVVDRYFDILDVEYNYLLSSIMFLDFSIILVRFIGYAFWLVMLSYVIDFVLLYKKTNNFYVLEVLSVYLDARMICFFVLILLSFIVRSYIDNIKSKINGKSNILNTTIKYIWLLYQTSDGHVSEAARESIRLRLSRYDFIKERQGGKYAAVAAEAGGPPLDGKGQDG